MATVSISHPPYSDDIITYENSARHLGLNAFTDHNLFKLWQARLIDKHGRMTRHLQNNARKTEHMQKNVLKSLHYNWLTLKYWSA